MEEQHMGGDGELIQLIRRHPVVTLFVLAFGLSWAVQIPRVRSPRRQWVEGGGLGSSPSRGEGSRRASRSLAPGLAMVCAGDSWTCCLLARHRGGLCAARWLRSAAVPKALSEDSLVLLPVFFLILALTDGLGEEHAWRGFALPRLLTRTTPWWPA